LPCKALCSSNRHLASCKGTSEFRKRKRRNIHPILEVSGRREAESLPA
jgi:hypothetical protein